MQTILSIAVGGALGAVLRHYFNNAATAITGGGFPWGIMLINILGSFIMGLLAGLFAYGWNPPPSFKLFITVGLLGGFTTFSAFSLDVIMLAERGMPAAALFYAVASVVLAAGGLYAGMLLVKAVAS